MARRRPFRYAALLRVRRHEEGLKAQALAAVRHDLRAAERQRAGIVDRQVATLQQAGLVAREEFDPANVRRYYQYERHLARLAVEKDAEVAQLRGVEDDRRAELEEAMKRKRIVERLKERQTQAFLTEFNKEAQKFADEVATNQSATRRRAQRHNRRDG